MADSLPLKARVGSLECDAVRNTSRLRIQAVRFVIFPLGLAACPTFRTLNPRAAQGGEQVAYGRDSADQTKNHYGQPYFLTSGR
jgi:hypothetical protein